MEQTKQTFQLPLGVVGRVDVGRLLREVDALNTFMKSAETREPGSQPQLPKTSKLLDELLEINDRSALKATDREEVELFLTNLRKQAPSIHMSFSADPSPLFTKRLITWLRQNIHPLLLLQIGLQPNIGAGVLVRTTNKYFDFSLREYFNEKKPVLLTKIRKSPDASHNPVSPSNLSKQDQGASDNGAGENTEPDDATETPDDKSSDEAGDVKTEDTRPQTDSLQESQVTQDENQPRPQPKQERTQNEQPKDVNPTELQVQTTPPVQQPPQPPQNSSQPNSDLSPTDAEDAKTADSVSTLPPSKESGAENYQSTTNPQGGQA